MPPTFTTAAQVQDNALAACCHAMRCSVSKSLSSNTSGEVVFGRDMLLDIPMIIDLLRIRNGQLLIDENLRRQTKLIKKF